LRVAFNWFDQQLLLTQIIKQPIPADFYANLGQLLSQQIMQFPRSDPRHAHSH
jgi:hypothetical protein